MMQATLDGIALHALFANGYRNLKKNMEAINDLNVFPVPDGDTGTNMVMTFGGGFKAMDAQTQHAGQYMQNLSRSVLLSARGNSGVIFSQFIHGLARGFEGKATVSLADMAQAFAFAQEDAYSAILTPVEGTILTLIRETAEFLAKNHSRYNSMEDGFAAIVTQMTASLKKTPELLPTLKEANVVDSGGAGLLCFFEGAHSFLCGGTVEDTPEIADMISLAPSAVNFGPDSRLEYGYCTEFILQLMNYKTDLSRFDLQQFTTPLREMGDSVVAVHNDGIVKIHIHTFTPEKVLGYARELGEFLSVKIENMSVQHNQTQIESEPEKERQKYAIVAVASGEGISEYFYSIGATCVIEGGQTSNPPVSAFLEAFRKADAEHIVVLPNNSNIILTANQAAEMYRESDIRVLPTKTVVEGYSALSMMNPWCETVEELLDDMGTNLDSVTSGYVTAAIRDAHIDGLEIRKDEFLGMEGKHVVVTGTDRLQTAMNLIRKITEKNSKDVIIVFYGQGVTEEEVAQLRSFLEKEYPLVDIGFVNGKQPVYDFIISLE